MSDKSFGDHTNRNIVKNPLLSSAVTGLSLEDLTYKAVLLPVTPSLDQITRPDQQQGSPTRTLEHHKHETSSFPSGDAFPNISLSNTPQNINVLDSKNKLNLEDRNTQSVKATAKSDDDFDVNEYIARLQGTRYVSAPLHSHLKEDQNANLETADENLEEINLNETIPAETTQQSLTADIAQNFSQLPTVLPHVASAVFSSFSNMLNYKSREQTPDHPRGTDQASKTAYDEVQFQTLDVGVPLVGVEEYKAPKEVAPPPKEMPIGGASNFRIASKKKYAQIPGLSSGDPPQTMNYPPVQNIQPMGHNTSLTGQNMPFMGQNMPPIGQNIPPIAQNVPFFDQSVLPKSQMPSFGQDTQFLSQNVPSLGHNMPPRSHNMAPANQNMPFRSENVPIGQNTPYHQASFSQHTQYSQNMPPFAQNVTQIAQIVTTTGQNMLNISKNMPSIGQSGSCFEQGAPPVGQIEPNLDPKMDVNLKTTETEVEVTIQEGNLNAITENQSTYNIFNPAFENTSENNPLKIGSSKPDLLTNTNYFTPVEHKDQNMPSNPGVAAIIPPPPMFSNVPRRDSQSSVEKSILPPSVARRISANQPIIKPAVAAPSFTENIFVPPMPDITDSGQADNNFSSGFSSAFVPAYNSSFKSEPIEPRSNIPLLSSQTNVPSSTPSVVFTTSTTYLIPSNEAKSSTFFTPTETTFVENTSIPLPTVPAADVLNSPQVMPPVFSKGLSTSFTPVTLASTIFTPGNDTKPINAPQSMFQSPLESVPLTLSSSINAPHEVTQISAIEQFEPLKHVAEPPKAVGNVNFRMNKKRPQYYAGPIEGVGIISTNVKPVIAPIAPVETGNIQGALFTPTQPMQLSIEAYSPPNIEHSAVPFDISRPVEQPSSQYAAFEMSKPQEYAYGTSFSMNHPESQNYEHEYNTPFDMSRDQTDPYNEPKKEFKGFGIIGSLKSKLGSIDINKIQSTVTTFFDPAYNDSKVTEPVGQDNALYQQQSFGQTLQGQSNFDIFVPKVEPNQHSQMTHGFDYSQNSQHLQSQDSYLQNQGYTQNATGHSTSGYFSDPKYSTEQVYTNNTLYDNTQVGCPGASSYDLPENIPEKVEELKAETSNTDNTIFYDPNAFTQKAMIKSSLQYSSINATYQNKDQSNAATKSKIVQQNVNYFDPNVENLTPNLNPSQQQKSCATGSEDASNMTYYNPNAFAQENRQIWEPQQSQDELASFSQSFDQHLKITDSTSVLDKHEPVFYNPNVFTVEGRQILKTQQKLGESLDDAHRISSEIHIDSKEIPFDSALNTSKYNTASIQAQTVQQSIPTNVPLLPAASFFDSSISTYLPQINKTDITNARSSTKDTQPEELLNKRIESKYSEINKTLSHMPIGTSSKTQDDFGIVDNDDKDIKYEKEQRVKEGNLIDSLTKDDIPVLGVSTVPLFGLSAIIADKSKEVPKSEKSLLCDITHRSESLFESKISTSFFENKEPDNKIISESQIKETPLDITGLRIDDVKNVLVIEPPQENIGELLKKNASSNKFENVPEKTPQHFKQQIDDCTSEAFREVSNMKFDENTSETYFKHSDDNEMKDTQKKASGNEDNSELNICETCREFSTPDHELKHKETEDLTSQLIENITSRMQLSHPLTVPFKDSDLPIDERSAYDAQQLDDIIHVAEETFTTLQAQSAIELLDNRTTSEIRDYGWTTQENVYPVAPHLDQHYDKKDDSDSLATKHSYDLGLVAISPNLESDYVFKLDPNNIGFSGNNSLFFDNLPVPTNASDEIKAEIKHSQEDVVLPRQMSMPTAPPEEEDSKSDEPGVLDVHSIEQDAKKDFPLEEEFIIEPSTDEFLSTDDDKIEFRERKRSSEDSTSNDTFTNRIENFKKTIDTSNDGAFEQKSYSSPPISMASYFDTGNYAVESHFRNSLISMRIPPGFEEEYARKLSGVSLGSENSTEPFIPDTSTQTRPVNTPTYSSPNDTKENIIGSEMHRKEITEVMAQDSVERKTEVITTQAIDNAVVIEDPTQTAPVLADVTKRSDVVAENVQSMSDPLNFFSANVEEPKPAEPSAPESFSRLASYFSMPAAQPEHSKSFFELSQSQNHYRHDPKSKDSDIQKSFFELSQSENHYIDDDTKNNIKELMKDLTSPQNIKDHTVKTVNYFNIELDNDVKLNNNAIPINIKIDEINLLKSESNVIKPVDNDSKDKNNDSDDIMKCGYCRRHIPGINTKVFIVKTAVNEPTEPSSDAEMPSQRENNVEKIGSVSHFADFDVEKQAEDEVTVVNENRGCSEYSLVKHHWFYRLDVEEKSVWRGFSNTDSKALEDAYHSSDLNENTLVATDGGRYDVNVMGRLRIAVYWKEKPTNVRRCSWFYKGTTDARYVPYTESVAEKLEEEYRHGVTTGEWHRKMVLPNSEMVIMHGPSVMVHFLHSGATDAFSTPPALLGKKMYRNPPKIRVTSNQDPKIDHLILLVHGAGEYKRMRFLDQAASRPRVVRRSHEESEIEESEPSKIDHLLLLCHGVGSACDMRFRSVEEVVEDFRTTSLQLLQSHYRNSYDSGLVSRVEVLPISWHEQLHSGETGVDKRLARVTLDSIPRLRAFTNHTVLDVLFYTSPVFHQTIIDTVCFELNRVYGMFRERNPHFKGEVSLGGHSLGSVILYDLLCHQKPQAPLVLSKLPSEKQYVKDSAGAMQPISYPQLEFPPAALYALGSPIAIFECIRGVESLGMEFSLPTCKHFFNIFHPYDPIAYRIEPLINPQLQNVKPSQIPHHKGRKRMHLELKDTMARVGADLKQKLIESLRTTWNKWKATPPTDGALEKVVEEEMEKEQLTGEEEPGASEMQASTEMLGRLNNGRRVDYVLQEAPLEMINEYLFAMSSHVGYWESEDTMLLMLREIYDALGVQPDCTVPQQSMTLQRNRTASQDETGKASNGADLPSTSRGST